MEKRKKGERREEGKKEERDLLVVCFILASTIKIVKIKKQGERAESARLWWVGEDEGRMHF